MNLPALSLRVRLVVAALFSTAVAWAQPAAHGTITGRVTAAHNQAALAGVEVQLDGSGLATSTERDGSYRLAGVPAGEHTVVFSYLGYDPVRRSITVPAGGVAALDAQFSSEIVQLASFKVEGVREGQARALNQQRTSGNLKNVVASDAIGNFPDKNVAESLQRVSGVSTVSWRGEPLYVTIRGANPAWNSISLDGISLMAANGSHSDQLGKDMRSVQLDAFPSSQVGSMEIVKAVTPDLDGDSIGGAVLLKGRSAFDLGRRSFTANVTGSYNDFVKKSGYKAGFSFSDVLGAQRDWGLSVTYSKERKRELEESNETNDWFLLTTTVNNATVSGFVPTTALQTYVDDDRKREAVSAALEKKFGFGRLYVRGFFNKFLEDDRRFGVRYMPGLTATGGNLDKTQPVAVSADGTVVTFTSTAATSRRQEQPQLLDANSSGVIVGGIWQGADWSVEGSGSFSRATEDFFTTLGQWVSGVTSNRAVIDYSDPSFWRVTQLSGPDFFDPTGYIFNSARWRNNYSKSEEQSGRVDANRTFTIGATPVKLQAGWRSRWGIKLNDNNVANYNGVRSGTLNLADARLGGIIDPDRGFLNGRYDFGPFVPLDKWGSFFEGSRAPFNAATGLFPDTTAGLLTTNSNSLNATLANDYKAHEDIHAGYVRADWSWGNLGVIAGARLERTELDLRGIKQSTTLASTNPARFQPYRDRRSYSNFMPGVHLRYAVGDRLVFRAAWTNSLARPSAGSMSPNITVDPINLTISGGNPGLHAVKSANGDVSVEYYLSSIGLVSAAAFTKSLDGPIYDSQAPTTFDAGSGPQRFIYSTSLNAGRATLRGLEFSYTQQLRFLPSPFDGLGVYANYTVTDSDVDVPSRPGESFTLFNQSKWLGNVALFYQKYDVTARLAYTFRSPYLSILLGPGTDTYFDRDHRLDFQIGYKFLRHWTVQVQANNLENTPERQYHGNRSRQEFYGLTGRFFSLGVSTEF